MVHLQYTSLDELQRSEGSIGTQTPAPNGPQSERLSGIEYLVSVDRMLTGAD